MEFDAKELAAATNNYRRSSVIGKGGFGAVYKGIVRGCLEVAIKVLTQVCSLLLCHPIRAYLHLQEGQQALMRSHPTSLQIQSELDALTRYSNVSPFYPSSGHNSFMLPPPPPPPPPMRKSLSGGVHIRSLFTTADHTHVLGTGP